MSKVLEIIKAKPNPAGKDKSFGIPKAAQLLGEWVDIKNIGTESIKFSTISLTHTEFNGYCQKTGTDCYWSGGSNSLLVGQILRVHTGKYADKHLMKQIDREGCNWHGYANRSNFVLNNKCGDILTVAWRDSFGNRKTDTVSYDGDQPEGAILVRRGNKLVVSSPSYV